MLSIREELEKESPSKKKILSSIFGKELNEEFQTLPETQFFDIVGEILNLNPIFFTDQLYNDIKKKIKKVHGDEGIKLIEQYLIKNYGLYSPEYITDIIKEYLKLNYQLKIKILTIFSDLRSKPEYQHLSNSDFNFIVGETLRLDPQFFMDSLYYELRNRINKQNRLEMDKYLTEKYNLFNGEHIIYEFKGNITFVDSQMVKASGGFSSNNPASVSLTAGSIFLTNYRIIAQGTITAKGGRQFGGGLLDLIFTPLSGFSKRAEAKETIRYSSPFYGYHFPTKNHINLKKKKNEISYRCIQDNQFKIIKIKITSEASQAEKDEQINTIFKILSKDVDHIKEVIKTLFEMVLKNRYKRFEILDLLRSLRSREEYQQLTDSEYLDTVETTYKMNPKFFMTNIYPKMICWDFKSFNSIKSNLIEFIENLNNEAI